VGFFNFSSKEKSKFFRLWREVFNCKKCYSINKGLKMAKILFIIASKEFRDPEYFLPKEILEKAGVETQTASSIGKDEGPAVGAEGGEVTPDLKIDEIQAEAFDGIVFVGGTGSQEYFDNLLAHQLAQDFAGQGKIVAAICVAPVILANAGVLKGKGATVFSSQSQALQDKGANFIDEAVVCDGNIITANGPAAAQEFGEKIVESLK